MPSADYPRAMTPQQVFDAFDRVRRAQSDGRYAPHKPLLMLAALARIQRGEPRLVPFATLEPQLKLLLTEFGPTGSAARRHLPFWHLSTDQQGALWQVAGPATLLRRAPGATPTLGELRQEGVSAGFAPALDAALRGSPALLQTVAWRVLESAFPPTLHADIASQLALDLEPAATPQAREPEAPYGGQRRAGRDPGFRARVLRAYEYRCCVCGFDLRVVHLPAGLEAAHIHWHHAGGPDIETNGLALCALHHKLFDLGAFTVEPTGMRVVFSQHAVGASRGTGGPLAHHGQPILPPQDARLLPDPRYLAWNRDSVFKKPERPWG